MRKFGITLIEMLIAAVISVAILTLIATSLRGSTDSIRFVQNSQMLTEDIRTAGNLISDYLSTASFVYPPGTVITLNTLSSYTVRNPITNTNVWTIGTHPAVAMLQPINPSNGEFRFVMIYAMNRGWVTNRTPTSEIPERSVPNDDKWVLYIYEVLVNVDVANRLPNGLPLTIPTRFPLVSTPGSNSGKLLADYVGSNRFTLSYPDCLGFDEAGIATLVSCPATPPTPLLAAHSAARVTFSLQGEIRQGGRDSRVPANPLRFEAAPRNLPKRLTDITLN
ncbi:MAG: type II secretion system GspH family protein [Meiothermus sp.]|nr:type II secretion system GspH family protein [Meiothermus sp.]